jgi:uncharacterized protein
MTRRNFLKAVALGMAAMAATASSSTLYATRLEPAWIQVHEQPIRLPHLRGEGMLGLRIAQISDIHMGGWMTPAHLGHVVDLLLARQPDLVVITGDFVTRHTDQDKDVADLAASLARLGREVPTYAVLGNHDYWRGADLLRNMLAEIHIHELRNSLVSLKRGDGVLHLAGVDDIWERHDRLERVLADLPAEGPAILLAHEPDFADTAAESGRFDLQLSGHSHGGQVVIPLLGPPVLPTLAKKYPSGLYQVGSMWQYTNRGVGMVSPSLRFNCPPEITLFTIA